MFKKETLKIAFVGHVDHGKSTLIGQLMLLTNSLPQDKIADIKKISKELGQDTALAYVVDQLKEEREGNLTIDTTQAFLKTPRRNYVLIDTPGHLEFIKNMMSGASEANAAILVIDAKEGIQEQTQRHAYLLKMLGLTNITVAVNKMDLVHYQEKVFNTIKNELQKLFNGLKLKPSFVIPLGAKEGVNILKKNRKLKWFKGPTLLQAMSGVPCKKNPGKQPLRFPIQDVYRLAGENIAVGRISSGVIKQHEEVVIFPQNTKAKVQSIRIFEKLKNKAHVGENIGITLNHSADIKRGNILCKTSDQSFSKKSFKGHMLWLSDKTLKKKDTVTFRSSTQETQGTVDAIEEKIDPITFKITEKNADNLKMNEVGKILFSFNQPLWVENFDSAKELGRFIIEDNHCPVGLGVITE